jgi:cytochrome c553
MRKVLVACAGDVWQHLMAQGRAGIPRIPCAATAQEDPAVIERAKALVTTCSTCHGPTVFRVVPTGDEPLRSQVVLSDQHVERSFRSHGGGERHAGTAAADPDVSP